MQKLLIALVIFMNHTQIVKCGNIYDFMYSNLNGLKTAIYDYYVIMRSSLRETFYGTTVKPDTTKIQSIRSFSSMVNDKQPLNVPSPFENNHEYRPHILTTPQLAATHGRIIETHVTYTVDGYLLTLHRLRRNANIKSGNKTIQRTILLHHGLLGSSADWIILGPKKSLPYILFDEGHDVWLANARGNYYSRAHVSMEINSEDFWNFSWQEMGERDLPAVLDYIRKTNNSTEPIDYIGHSMGATALLVLLSVEHNYNSYIRIAFLLAPLAFMAHTHGPLEMMAKLEYEHLVNILGSKEFMPSRRTLIPEPYVSLKSKLCNDLDIFCNNPLLFLTGSPLQEGSRTTVFADQLQEYVPAGGSTKTIVHYLMLISSKKFHHFDKPDWQFKLKYISVPILILSSNDDLVSNATDNQMLYLSILNPLGHIIINGQKMSHNEFAWGFNADLLFYYKIRDLIELGPDVNKSNG